MRTIFILFALLSASASHAEYSMFTLTTHAQTSTVAITGYADPFIGDIDEISVTCPVGTTGAVAVAAIDPYSTNALVLGTNATVTGQIVWRPRVVAPAVGGATALTVTNTVANDRFRVQGETIRAVVSEATTTSAVFRVFIKTK